MDVLGEGYEFKGMVRCISHHFTISVNNLVCFSQMFFLNSGSFEYSSYPNGWFFAIFGKS